MLVLSRKVGQRVQIGSGIEVIVLAAHKGRVKLGVAAPAEMPIRRGDPPREGHAGGSDQETSGPETEDLEAQRV